MSEDEIDAAMREVGLLVGRLPKIRPFRPLPGPPSIAWLPRVVARLRRHFVRVEVRPPAGRDTLARLTQVFPQCPPDVAAFYEICDGIDAGVDFDGRIYDLDEALGIREGIVEYWGPRYLPLRGDLGGGGDCLVVGPGPAEGAVVCVESTMMGPCLVAASGLWTFLDMWSDWLVHSHTPDGEAIEHGDDVAHEVMRKFPGLDKVAFLQRLMEAGESAGAGSGSRLSHPWPYDRRWMRRRDPGLGPHVDSDEVRRWLDAYGHIDETPRP